MDDRMFLDRLREDARDTLTRSAYADWLEERDDPRGEYLRREIELATVAVDDPRFPDLARWVREREAMNDPAWVAAACPLWDAILFGYEPGRKLTVIKVIRELTWISLMRAKGLSEALPAALFRGVPFHAAWHAVARLLAAVGEWPHAVRIERSEAATGPGWPEQVRPLWPHAVELIRRIEGKREELVEALRPMIPATPWMTPEDWAEWPLPVELQSFRLRREAEAFAAQLDGLAETMIAEPERASDATKMPFDYWQR